MIYYESHKLNSLNFPQIKIWLALHKIQPPERNLRIPDMGRKGPKNPRPFTIWALKCEAALIN